MKDEPLCAIDINVDADTKYYCLVTNDSVEYAAPINVLFVETTYLGVKLSLPPIFDNIDMLLHWLYNQDIDTRYNYMPMRISAERVDMLVKIAREMYEDSIPITVNGCGVVGGCNQRHQLQSVKHNQARMVPLLSLKDVRGQFVGFSSPCTETRTAIKQDELLIQEHDQATRVADQATLNKRFARPQFNGWDDDTLDDPYAQ